MRLSDLHPFRISTDPWGVLGMILALWLAIFGVLYVMSMVASMPTKDVSRMCDHLKDSTAAFDREACKK